jgi:hypothetical protein
MAGENAMPSPDTAPLSTPSAPPPDIQNNSPLTGAESTDSGVTIQRRGADIATNPASQVDASQPTNPGLQMPAQFGSVQQPQAPVIRTPQPRPWAAILQGALYGLMGASEKGEGRGGFLQGLGMGVKGYMQGKAAEGQQAQAQQDIKFKSAQAADLLVEARIHQTQLDNLPQEIADAHTKSALDIVDTLRGQGIPFTVTNNDPKSIAAQLAAETKTSGGVGEAIHLNVGDKIFSIRATDLNAGPVGLSLINEMLGYQGQKPMDGATFANMPQTTKTQLYDQAIKFKIPVPNPENLAQYKNYLSNAETQNNAANVKVLTPIVKNLQDGVDAINLQQTNQAAAKASAEEKAKQESSNKSGYAVTTGPDGEQHTVQATYAQALSSGMANWREVKQTDIGKDQHDIKVLNDIQTKSDNVKDDSKMMDAKSWAQTLIAAKYLADNPNSTTDQIIRNSAMGAASGPLRKYIDDILSLRESSMGLQKVLTGSARSNETQIKALQATLPGLEPDSNSVLMKIGNFDQNLTLLGQGLPENTGVSFVKPKTIIVADPKGNVHEFRNQVEANNFKRLMAQAQQAGK